MSTRRKRPKTTRKLALIVHPDQLKTEAEQEAFVDKAVDFMLDLINEALAARGEPPLR
jgi:hypothetical protein